MKVLSGLLTAIALLGVVALGGWQLMVHPDTPLPPAWNPTQPLQVSDEVTWITGWKLDRTIADPGLCKSVLRPASSGYDDLPDFEASDQCHIRNRVAVRGFGSAGVAPVETTCAVALRMAMWERHGVQPAAETYLGTSVTRMRHFSSYNCRQIRTTGGNGARMSLHATAEAIDISGFDLADGRRLTLKTDWDSEPEFFRAVRDSACTWFKTTLGPEYNALHADHFHLQSRGWGTCR